MAVTLRRSAIRIQNLLAVGVLCAGCGKSVEEKPESRSNVSQTSNDSAKSIGAGNQAASTVSPSLETKDAAPHSGAAAGADATGAGSNDVRVKPVSPDEFKRVIASQHGKVILVDFWATYCTPCRAKFPATLALGRKYADRGLIVVSMSMDSPEPKYLKEIVKFLTEQNAAIINLANRLDDPEAAFTALGVDGGALPHYKVFDRHGKPKAKFGGDPDRPFNEKDVEAAVVAALAEK